MHKYTQRHKLTHTLSFRILAINKAPYYKDFKLSYCQKTIFSVPPHLHAVSSDITGRGDCYTHSWWVLVIVHVLYCVLIFLSMHPHDIFWTYVQPAGSQRSPCVERCMQAPVRCACWLHSGPGPLEAQDRPPQSPPPHRTALLCTSSSGPRAAAGVGAQVWEQGQRQG